MKNAVARRPCRVESASGPSSASWTPTGVSGRPTGATLRCWPCDRTFAKKESVSEGTRLLLCCAVLVWSGGLGSWSAWLLVCLAPGLLGSWAAGLVWSSLQPYQLIRLHVAPQGRRWSSWLWTRCGRLTQTRCTHETRRVQTTQPWPCYSERCVFVAVCPGDRADQQRRAATVREPWLCAAQTVRNSCV